MSAEDRVARDKARFDEWARHAATSGETPAIDAATVVVLRDGDDGLETLMLRRNSKIAFGGMWVFPGGRVDPDDWRGGDDPLAAARAAAVREAQEEAALAIAEPDLVLFAHWIPPPIAPKRYATWFFAAGVDDHVHTIDDGEIIDSDWMTPATCLGRHHEGEVELAPPTWVTLHSIRQQRSVDTALDLLRHRPPRHHATRIVPTDNGPIAMWDGDAGYETIDHTIVGPRHRLEMFHDGYRYDDSGIVE
ncbi:MAG: NUDIX hydrolase [Acidimicrobiales bacterium]|nr:NUDIX hydrolase [Acidimicrobiales bacterium]